MMKLGLMKQFFDTMEEDWQSPIACEIASRWVDETATVRCIRASANLVFRVHTAGRDHILRFNHASERAAEYIAAELAYIEHLAGRGIRVARPIPSLAGRAIESVPTALGVFHGVLFEALDGEHLELDDLDAAGWERWGRALGELHAASEGLEIGGRPDWADHLAMARQIIPRSEAGAWAELDAAEELLSTLSAGRDHFGLIHYDLELDNLVWQDGRAGVYDCDDCAYYWFAADVVNALRGLFDDRVDRVDLHDERFQSFLKGYRSARRLEGEALRQLPLLLRVNNLVGFARVYRSIAEGPLEDEPGWTAELRAKLNRILDQYRAGFQDHPIRGHLTPT